MRLPCLLLAAAFVSCDVPVSATEDTHPPSAWIGGELSIDRAAAPGGPAFVFRYDCDDPPPPAGSGRPRDFLVVPEDRWDEGRAAFTFPTVAPGTCALLAGFIDRDGDFDVAYGVTAQATAGDVAFTPLAVTVGPEEGGDVAPIGDLRLRAETVVPLERPAFTALDVATGVSPVILLGAAPGTTPNTILSISAVDLQTDLLDVDPSLFTVVFAPDADGNGLPDDGNGDGGPDVVWPRVLVRQLDPLDPTGMTVVDGGVTLPGVIMAANPQDPTNPATNLLMQSAMQGLPFDGQAVLLTTGFLVVVPPLVITSLDPLTLSPIEAVAASGLTVRGDYQILLMNRTGQVWNLPNELVSFGLDAQGTRLRIE